MFIKIHSSYRDVVAICDSELIGKRFEEGKRQLDIRENFYKDMKVTKQEAVRIIKQQAAEDSTFNIVGEKAIEASIEAGVINEDSVDMIESIPFTLILV